MNLILSLIALGAGGLVAYIGLTDPPGGVAGVLGRTLRGEPQQTKQRGPSLASQMLGNLLSGGTAHPRAGAAALGGANPGMSVSGAAAVKHYNLGAVKPHVAQAAGEIAPLFGVHTVLGFGERDTPDSDHPKGLALDFMCNRVQGEAIARYVDANHGRLLVSYRIWRQHIQSYDGRGNRKMEDRGSPTANHMDHVHVSFLPYSPSKGATHPGVQPR